MNKIKIKHLLEYLNPSLILSYFFYHNIFLVLIGIIISLYLINTELIDNLINSINKVLKIILNIRHPNHNSKVIKAESIQIKLTKEDSQPTLVERIEELGFIPSVNNENNEVA